MFFFGGVHEPRHPWPLFFKFFVIRLQAFMQGGPEGGTPEKPVGTVWMARADASGVAARRLQLSQGRDRIRQAAVSHGLRWLMEDWLAGRRRLSLQGA